MHVGLKRFARCLAANWVRCVTGILVVLGTVVRMRQWMQTRSLWLDEASLALNFDRFDLVQIITRPLTAMQSAPPGYLFATELSVRLFGRSEKSLRLVALIAGLAALGLAVLVARRLLTNSFARLVFIALVAWSPALIYYSNEVKQYSLDVLGMLVVLLLWSMRNSSRRRSLMAISGLAVALFSLVGVVALVALVLAAALERWSARRDHRRDGSGSDLDLLGDPDDPPSSLFRGRGWLVLGAWTFGIALHGVYTLYAGVDRAWMRQWWIERDAFPPRSLSGLGWYVQSVQRLAWVGIGSRERVGAVGETGPLLLTGIVLLFATIAFWGRRDLRLFGISLFCLVWSLAELRIYPTSGRLSLYLVPVVVLAVAAGFDAAISKSGRIRTTLVAMAVAALVLPQGVSAVHRIIEPRDDGDMRQIAQQLAAYSLPTDEIVSVPFPSEAMWYGLANLVERNNFSSARAPDELSPKIIYSTAKRVWVVSTLNPKIAADIVDAMSEFGYRPVCVELSKGAYLALLVQEDAIGEFDFEGGCPTVGST